MPGEDRTERATPRRRLKAREKGQIARSRDLSGSLSLLAAVLLAYWLGASFPSEWLSFFSGVLDSAIHSDLGAGTHLFSWSNILIFRWCAPLMLAAWAVAVGGTFAQGGILFSAEAFAPNWERLNPATNLRNVFSIAGLSRLLKSLLPFFLILYLLYGVFAREWGEMVGAADTSVTAVLARCVSLIFEVAWKSTLVMLVWSAFDYMLQRLNFERSLRMSKEEVKEEMKDTEGNPQIRSRIRKIRRELRRRWKLKDVKRATVVVTNPEHYAVALEYRPEAMRAPVVIAKGRNLLAQKIKHFALWHDVPLIENRPLAQALYKSVEVGESIPANLYTAVAEILAFIYRAQARQAAASAQPASALRR